MANLDRCLKIIEKNKETENEVTVHQLTIAGETFDVKTMTRAEKRNFTYMHEINNKKPTNAGDIVKKMKPFIYRAFELAPLAVKAKEAGLISCYYDVVEALFDPQQIIDIIGFISDINGLGKKEEDVTEDIEETKKQ